MRRKSRTAGTAQQRRRILLVDDHPLVRERLAEILNREADLTVCGEAEDRHEAIAAIRTKRPDLVIVDLTLKNSDGLELIKDIRARWPKVRMLVVSMHDESLYAERVIRAGALGYITKQEATRKILLAVRRVLAGNIYLKEGIATHIVSRLTARPGAVAATPAERLSDRELQVFDLTGSGLDSSEIAERLHLSVKTVETYRARIREKLKLEDSSELLQWAISWTHGR
ncbi:MAG: response regulator transcription factor [Verrucomicrobiota bacterium]|jgi:DNA-binding NarL/FixJ family response regulator